MQYSECRVDILCDLMVPFPSVVKGPGFIWHTLVETVRFNGHVFFFLC